MKVTYQIRTGDFEYINIEREVASHEEAILCFSHLKETYNAPKTPEIASRSDESLRDGVFNVLLDKYLNGGKLTSEEYESCTIVQKIVLQCLKRAFARIKNKE